MPILHLTLTPPPPLAEGVSHDPCNAEVYCGDHAASEWETQAIQAEIRKITGVRNMRAFLDVHTFGQYILMPFG